MRFLGIGLCALFITSSCGNKKQVPVTIAEQKDAGQPAMDGVVHLGTEAGSCGLYILLKDGTCVYPINLDESFRKEGAEVKFSFTPSRAPLPEGCEACRAVVIDQIR
jgi:hypothetical protein